MMAGSEPPKPSTSTTPLGASATKTTVLASAVSARQTIGVFDAALTTRVMPLPLKSFKKRSTRPLVSPVTRLPAREVNSTLLPLAETPQTSPSAAWPEALAEASASVASVAGAGGGGGGGGLRRPSAVARCVSAALAEA